MVLALSHRCSADVDCAILDITSPVILCPTLGLCKCGASSLSTSTLMSVENPFLLSDVIFL